jgi:NAD(P)-dependent dehydrogenase (short-subunit alcohol dehydrogenase family)
MKPVISLGRRRLGARLMSKVLITGSADGLGREAAKQLAREGHEVVLHARDEARAQQAMAGVPGAAAALPGDLSSIITTRALADLINAAGVFRPTSWRPTC